MSAVEVEEVVPEEFRGLSRSEVRKEFEGNLREFVATRSADLARLGPLTAPEGPEPSAEEWIALGLDPDLQEWAAERWPASSWRSYLEPVADHREALADLDARRARWPRPEMAHRFETAEAVRLAKVDRRRFSARDLALDSTAVAVLMALALPDLVAELRERASTKYRREESRKRRERRLRARQGEADAA